MFSSLFSTGCGLQLGTFTLGELLPLVEGQFKILAAAQPVSRVVADPNTPADIREKLLFAEEVRQFAIDRLHLNAGKSYTTYYDTGDNPPSYNVTAAPMLRLEAVMFDYPLAGRVPYSAFFSLDEAEAFADKLHEQGNDTMVSEVPAYSTLGLFPDPIYTSFLNQGDIVIAETICHELTHNTVISDNADFGESLASYVGRYGAQLFYQENRANDPQKYAEVVSYYHDTDLFAEASGRLFDYMDAFYKAQAAAGTSENDIKVGRQQAWTEAQNVYDHEYLPRFDNQDNYSGLDDLPLNNALLLGWRRYNMNLKVFEQVRLAVGGEIEAALPVFKAAADRNDPFGYLDNWLLQRGITPEK